MQYSLMTLATILGAAMAQTWGFDTITAPTRDEVLTAGSSYTIQWTPDATYDADTVSIQLLAGASNTTLQISPTEVAKNVKSLDGSYVWTIPASLEQANTYGFKLYLDKDASIFQYSNPFSITFGGVSSSAASTSAAALTSAAASTTAAAASTSVAIEKAITTSSAVLTPAHFANTTAPNTDLPEPVSGAAASTNAIKTTLSASKGTSKATGGAASPTGVASGNSTVTAGAAGVAAPLALLAGAVALAF